MGKRIRPKFIPGGSGMRQFLTSSFSDGLVWGNKRDSGRAQRVLCLWPHRGLRCRVLLITTLCLGLALSQTLFAQLVNGSLVGAVTDAAGRVVTGSSVTLTNLGTSEKKTTRTDSNGDYQFLFLIPGQYQVEIARTGFKTFSRGPVDIRVQSATHVDAALEVGAVQQTVA